MTYSLFFACFAIASYCLISLYLVQFLKQPSNTNPNWLIVSYIIAFFAHAMSLPEQILTQQGPSFDLASSLSIISLAMCILLTLISKRPPAIQGLIVFPLAAFNLFLSLMTKNQFPTAAQLSLPTTLHIISSIIAYAVLTLAFLQTLLLTLQIRLLKQKNLHPLQPHLPPLEATETALFNLLKAGIIFLTISITSGLLFHDDLLEQKLAHKALFSVLAWCIFSLVLLGRYLRGWRGPIAIKWTQSGFMLLALGYIGSKAAIQLIATNA